MSAGERYRPVDQTSSSIEYSQFQSFCRAAKAMKNDISVSAIEELMAMQLPDLQLRTRSGLLTSAKEVARCKCIKRKTELYRLEHTVAACMLFLDALTAESELLSEVQRIWKAGDLGTALLLANQVLFLHPRDFSRRAMFPLETESEWVIKANVLASYQLSLDGCEAALSAEALFRNQHSLEVATVRISTGLAANFKSLGDRLLTEFHDEEKAACCYTKARAAAVCIAKDYLTLAQVKRELMGADVRGDFGQEVVRALTDYYTAIQAKSQALHFLQQERSPAERLAAIALSLGDKAMARAYSLQISRDNFWSRSKWMTLADLSAQFGDPQRAMYEYEKAFRENTPQNEDLVPKVLGMNAALESGEPLPACFFAQAQELISTRRIRREAHVPSRNLYPCDEMGAEMRDVQRVECYCHDPHVLMAEALVAQSRLNEAQVELLTAAESFSQRNTMNTAWAWKRLGDFTHYSLHDPQAAVPYYDKAIEVLRTCTAVSCWIYESTFAPFISSLSPQQKCMFHEFSSAFKRHGSLFTAALFSTKLPRDDKDSLCRFCFNVYVRCAKKCFSADDFPGGLRHLLRLRLHSAETHSGSPYQIINYLWNTNGRMKQYAQAEQMAIVDKRRTYVNFLEAVFRGLYQSASISTHVMDDSDLSEGESFFGGREYNQDE